MYQRKKLFKTSTLSFNFISTSRKAEGQQKLAKKITYFTIQFRSKISLILRTSAQSTLQKTCSCNTAKIQTLEIFQQTCLWLLSRSPRTAFSKHWECKCLYIPVYLRRKLSTFIAFIKIQLYFSILILPSIALKRRNFPGNLDLRVRLWLSFS